MTIKSNRERRLEAGIMAMARKRDGHLSMLKKVLAEIERIVEADDEYSHVWLEALGTDLGHYLAPHLGAVKVTHVPKQSAVA